MKVTDGLIWQVSLVNEIESRVITAPRYDRRPMGASIAFGTVVFRIALLVFHNLPKKICDIVVGICRKRGVF